MKKVFFCGGGTGGHIYPALAIREILLHEFPNEIQTAFIGLSDGMEATIVKRIPDLPFLTIRAQGMPREISWKWLTFPGRNLLGLFDALRHLRKGRPDLVVTTGGYVSFPVLLAAKILGISYVIHEQNAAMGVTNRIFAGGAKKILLTFPEAGIGMKNFPLNAPESNSESEKDSSERRIVVTGNPVRQEFLKKSPPENRFGKKSGEFWILSVGGSRGATSLNRTCLEFSKTWIKNNPDWHLLQISGERDFEKMKTGIGDNPRHIVLPYLHEMREGFDVADILLSRSGATILAEIACCRKPAILVPFPFATDNHQERNARVLENQGAAKVILDRDLTVDVLGETLKTLIENHSLEKMAEKMALSRPPDVENRIFSALRTILN